MAIAEKQTRTQGTDINEVTDVVGNIAGAAFQADEMLGKIDEVLESLTNRFDRVEQRLDNMYTVTDAVKLSTPFSGPDLHTGLMSWRRRLSVGRNSCRVFRSI